LTHNRPCGDAAIRKILICPFEGFQRGRGESILPLTDVDRYELDPRSWDQVPIKSRVAVSSTLTDNKLIQLYSLWCRQQNRFPFIHERIKQLIEDWYQRTLTYGRTSRTPYSSDNLFWQDLFSRVKVPAYELEMEAEPKTYSLYSPLKARLILLLPHRESPYDRSLRV